jgi:hypothetical protein
MKHSVAAPAERDQVRFAIVPHLTPGNDVVDFEPSAETAVLTAPVVAPQHGLT